MRKNKSKSRESTNNSFPTVVVIDSKPKTKKRKSPRRPSGTPNRLTITGLILAILGSAGIGAGIYFVVTQLNGHGDIIDDGRFNLELEKISYLAQIEHMDSLTEQEAITIKSGVQASIDAKMNQLKLELNVDYTISNINDIQSGVRLDSIKVMVNSVENSTKCRGSLIVRLNGQENINNRSIPTIIVPANQADNLNNLTALSIRNQITSNVNEVLNQGQPNEEGVDYEIIKLDLIIGGAKFADYSNALSVAAITTSTNLTGTFKINFQLQN
ncbi:MAG: hypothetical protein REH79_03585 [Spiroplasma sp.]|nr:hypothetical protein [Spiroplasma sp.]